MRDVLFALLLTGCTVAHAQRAYKLSGDFRGVHDPSIIKQGDTWYLFATGKAPDGGQLAIRCSQNLKEWKLCGHVFDSIPQWIHETSPGATDLWAPDISKFNGQYRLYYAYSLFGKNLSGIALATNKTLDQKDPDYKWMDLGLVVKSAAADGFNAIDPNFIVDAEGKSWLAFGSFWGGIKLIRLGADGKASSEEHTVYALASRDKQDWHAVEAPFVTTHDGYYYLFVSWDLCCKGAKSTYRTMVGRAKEVTGPYVDASGIAMTLGGGTQVLAENKTWVGPGGESVLMGSPNDLLAFHAYDAKTGKPALHISTIAWVNGWPQMAVDK